LTRTRGGGSLIILTEIQTQLPPRIVVNWVAPDPIRSDPLLLVDNLKVGKKTDRTLCLCTGNEHVVVLLSLRKKLLPVTSCSRLSKAAATASSMSSSKVMAQ
jgi:hypothetical protein